MAIVRRDTSPLGSRARTSAQPLHVCFVSIAYGSLPLEMTGCGSMALLEYVTTQLA